VGFLFVSVESKHRNSLFQYRSETTKTNCFGIEAKQPKQTVSKQTEKNQKTEKTEKTGKP
jgi:hypothetical protein